MGLGVSPSFLMGYPILPDGLGYPILPDSMVLPSFPMGVGNPSLVRMGVPWGSPHPGQAPGQDREVPWGTSSVRTGTGWGIPHWDWGWMKYPTPSGLDEVPPPPKVRSQSSTASTCYTAGGMPLAFTQDDFLVQFNV